MCGIAGIINIRKAIAEEEIRSMTDVISHRGPDGTGIWISEDRHVGLGHRRLSIIDLSDCGSQPMHFKQDRYTIVFNGEIYNYLEIRDQLVNQGYQFRSTSDTEVLLALYDLRKKDCLQYLDGMFAFAIWDKEEKILFFARDRFGEKPFHYSYKKNEHFVFGSEMKELWAAGIQKEINPDMLYRYLVGKEVFNNNDTSETFFKNIVRLPAAHYGILSIPTLELSIHQYWDINYESIDTSISDKDAVEKLQDLLYTSVKRRMRSDVPVGSSLSGGLDSSIVVGAIENMAKGNTIKQNTFSARFPGFIKDEGPYIEKVLSRLKNVEAHSTFPDDQKLLAELEKIAWHQEEPFNSASIFVQYSVMKLAKEKNVTVLLDGQGADEVFAGYHTYYRPFFNELKKLDKSLYQEQLKSYLELQSSNTINSIAYRPGFAEWSKNGLNSGLKNILRKKFQLYKQMQQPFLNRDFFMAHNNIETGINTRFTDLNHSLYHSTMGPGLQELLRYADRNSMAHSREVRLPFLSHELVEFMFTLPAKMKIRNGWTKYILREAFKDIVPAEIAWRKDKIGYEAPQQQWLNTPAIGELLRSYKEKLVEQKILHKNVLIASEGNGNFSNDKNWQVLMTGMIL